MSRALVVAALVACSGPLSARAQTAALALYDVEVIAPRPVRRYVIEDFIRAHAAELVACVEGPTALTADLRADAEENEVEIIAVPPDDRSSAETACLRRELTALALLDAGVRDRDRLRIDLRFAEELVFEGEATAVGGAARAAGCGHGRDNTRPVTFSVAAVLVGDLPVETYEVAWHDCTSSRRELRAELVGHRFRVRLRREHGYWQVVGSEPRD